MVLTKDKNIRKKSPSKEKEDTFDRVRREGREQRASVIAKEKQKHLDKIIEETRLEKIVMPHLDKLEMQLREKDTRTFWTFPDRAGFKKIKNMTFDQMQKMVKTDVKKYANRKICLIDSTFLQNSNITNIYRRDGILLITKIVVFHMDNNATLNGKNKSIGCTFNWKLEDFKLTKLNYKLIETIMRPVVDKQYDYSSFSGFPIAFVIKDLKKTGVDFNEALVPLGGC